jgi:hypothetical protein
MSQQRIWNFGDPFTAEKTKQIQKVLNCPGVYEGFDISAFSATKISLSADGWLLQPDGIMITETADVQLTLASMPSASTTYTVTCRHTDAKTIGGSVAVYAIEKAVYSVGSLSDGVVLGWIYHPGGALPLTDPLVVIVTAPKNGCDLIAHADRHENGGSDALYIDDLPTVETDTDKVLVPDGSGGVAWGSGSQSSWSVVSLIPVTSADINHIFVAWETVYIRPYATGASYTSNILLTFPTPDAGSAGKQIKIKFDLSNFDDELYLPNDVMLFQISCPTGTIEYLNPFTVFLTHDMCLMFESDGSGNWMRIV